MSHHVITTCGEYRRQIGRTDAIPQRSSVYRFDSILRDERVYDRGNISADTGLIAPSPGVTLPNNNDPYGGEGIMGKANPLIEPDIAKQNRAADDSERVPTEGRDWLFLLLSAGMAALLAIGTSLLSTFAGGTLWAYVASAACAVLAFFLLFLGFLRLRGSIRDAVAGSFLLGYLWLLSQLLFRPGLRDGLLQNASGQLVFLQFTVIVGIVVAFYFAASAAVNVTAKLANPRSRENSDAEHKYEAFKPVEPGEREYLARREAAKQS
jgi:hypothetical protein